MSGVVRNFLKKTKELMLTVTNHQKEKIKNGKWKEYNKRGVLIAEGLFLNNKKHGMWREFYDHTGSIMIEENYENGISHGRFASFHPNGKVLSEGNFIMGQRVGYFKIYDEHGNNASNLYFVNDIQIEDTIDAV